MFIPLRQKLLTGSKMESMAQGGDLPRQEDGKRATAQIGCWDTQVAVMESEDNRVEGVHKASTPRGPGS